MKSYKKSWILKSILIFCFVAIDLISKFFLQKYFESGGDVIEVIPNFFRFEYVKNSGISFGLFQGSAIASLVLPIIFVICFIVYDIVCKEKNIAYNIGFSLIIGGAIGNLYDRILLKFVRDFFAFSFFPFVFNFADACVCVGFVVYIIYIVISIIKSSNDKKISVNENNEKLKDLKSELKDSDKENVIENNKADELHNEVKKSTNNDKISNEDKISNNDKISNEDINKNLNKVALKKSKVNKK